MIHARLAYKGIIVQAQQAQPHHVLQATTEPALDHLQPQAVHHVRLEHTAMQQQPLLLTHAFLAQQGTGA